MAQMSVNRFGLVIQMTGIQMSVGNYIGIGGAIVIFGLTLLVMTKAFLVPWLVRHVRFRCQSEQTLVVNDRVQGVRISLGRSRRD